MSFCSCFFQRCARHAELLTKYRGTQKCKHPLGCSFFKFSLIFTVFISYCHHSWLTGQHKKRGPFSVVSFHVYVRNFRPLWLAVLWRNMWHPRRLSESCRCVPLAPSLPGTHPVVTAAGTGARCGPLPAGTEGLVPPLTHGFPVMLRYTLTYKYNLLRRDR